MQHPKAAQTTLHPTTIFFRSSILHWNNIGKGKLGGLFISAMSLARLTSKEKPTKNSLQIKRAQALLSFHCDSIGCFKNNFFFWNYHLLEDFLASFDAKFFWLTHWKRSIKIVIELQLLPDYIRVRLTESQMPTRFAVFYI